jgi:hypothetical protein
MPASSKAQQRFFGVVKAMQKGDKAKEGEAGKIAKRMSKKDVDKYAKTKHKGLPSKVKKEQRVRELIRKMVREELSEAAKRDYKAEYKKFQSSTKSKKYRAELNAYNRKKGTYGNGDGKDASHKGGKIVGFESQSKNRGRAEKSRLKKEGTCGYGENGKLGEEPAGPHLIKKKKIKEGKDTIFDVAKKVMKDKQHQNYKSRKGMVKLDMQTANLLMQVFKKINPKMKKILSDLGEKNPAQLVATLQAVVK